jgi:hypothetical protein
MNAPFAQIDGPHVLTAETVFVTAAIRAVVAAAVPQPFSCDRVPARGTADQPLAADDP